MSENRFKEGMQSTFLRISAISLACAIHCLSPQTAWADAPSPSSEEGSAPKAAVTILDTDVNTIAAAAEDTERPVQNGATAIMGASANPAPKVLILYAPYGNGHKSAAEAIKNDIENRPQKPVVVLTDVTAFLKNKTKDNTLSLYDQLTKKMPEVYDLWFRFYMALGARRSPDKLPVVRYYDADKLAEFIRQEKPKVIVSTFNHATEVLIKLRSTQQIDQGIKIAWQHTDYVEEKYFANLSRKIDMTFLPHGDMVRTWIKSYKVPASKVMSPGIAVNSNLQKQQTAAEKDVFMRTNGLDPQLKTVTIMSGAAGVGDFPLMVQSLASSTSEPLQIVALCAKNKPHYDALLALKSSLPSNIKLVVRGLIRPEDVADYFKSSDVVVGKAGGLGSTEIFTIGKPFVMLDINGGQERSNIGFFEARNLAVGTRRQKDIGKTVQSLLRDPARMEAMVEAQNEFVSQLDNKRIGEWVGTEALRTKQPHWISVGIKCVVDQFKAFF